MYNLARRYNNAKAADKRFPDEYPKLFIYHKPSKELYHYNHQTSSEFVGKVPSSNRLKSLINNYKITLK
ncbi:MAG: hypothetical protein LUG18_01465 [Candidatus Azobacteroides sp.]|nr:hypothetical protein [Candidatus Azobacteroides sp.]